MIDDTEEAAMAEQEPAVPEPGEMADAEQEPAVPEPEEMAVEMKPEPMAAREEPEPAEMAVEEPEQEPRSAVPGEEPPKVEEDAMMTDGDGEKVPDEEGVPETEEAEAMEEPVVNSFDVGEIAELASAALQSGKVEEGRRVYAEALLNWEDDLAFGDQVDDVKATAIVDLWLSYATFERSLKQFKQAVQVFESAAASPIAGASATFWLEYAAFCADRNKLENAKLVYGRALDAVRDPAVIWDAYLQFHIEVLGDEDMTMDDLRAQHRGDDVDLTKKKRKRARDFLDDEFPTAATKEDEDQPVEEEDESPQEDEEEEEEDEEDYGVLFGREPLTARDGDLPTLSPEETQQFVNFAREPTALDIVEGLRLTDLLATAKIEETWASMRFLQAAKLRNAVHDPALLADVVAEIRAETKSLKKRTSTELTRLNADIYAALQRAGVPTFDDDDASKNNPVKRATQKRVLRATLAANVRAHQRY